MLIPSNLTLPMLEQFVGSVIQQLQNAGTTLEGNGSIVIGSATTQISALMNQLKAMIGENFTKPISQLTQEIKNIASQIYSSVSRLDALLKNQQACLLVNSQIFLAGVSTIISSIKSGIPVISDDAPRIDYFQFVGHTPGVVPKEGGQVVINGFDLWEDNQYPPDVRIFGEDRTTLIKSIVPQKGPNIHTFLFQLDADFIRTHQGKILQLQVIPKEARWLDWFGPKILGTFFMPIVIPAIQFSKFQVIAHLQYETEVDTIEVLDYRRFGMGNDSCEDRKNYAHTEAWQLPTGAQILGVETKDYDIRNQTNVQFSFAGSTITASGWLDTATCICPPLVGCHLLHDTHWWASAAPKISYKKSGEQLVDGSSAFREMQNNKVTSLVKLPKQNDADAADTFWFEVAIDNGETKKIIFTSPKITVDNFSTDAQGLLIDARYNSTIVEGNAELSVTISLPHCGL